LVHVKMVLSAYQSPKPTQINYTEDWSHGAF
jgi:hypothetical protein